MEAVVDKFGRPIRDLRISVTDRCNFRCTYCMPKEVFGDDYVFLPKEELLTFEEVERLARLFATLGVKKLRLTGGEPLLRKDLPDLIEKLIHTEGIEDIGLTTNAVLLGSLAEKLYQTGLRRLNISLDALDPFVFGEMNGRGTNPQMILRNIELAKEMGFHIKVNMVVQKDVNEQEIIPMAMHFKERGITLRFIEFMDGGNDNAWSFDKVVTKKDILRLLQTEFELEPVDADYFGEVAKRYRYKDNGLEVGYITTVYESFCCACTTVRSCYDGKICTCLFATEGHHLRELVRSGKSDEASREALVGLRHESDDRYSDERTVETAKKRNKINMSYIGG